MYKLTYLLEISQITSLYWPGFVGSIDKNRCPIKIHTSEHLQSLSGGLTSYINTRNGARQLGGLSKRCAVLGVGAPPEPPTCTALLLPNSLE
jgi:hypothetical protein